MKDEELDQLRTSLLHAYDPHKPFTQRLAKVVKDRIAVAKEVSAKALVKNKNAKGAA